VDAGTHPQTSDEILRKLSDLMPGLPKRLQQCAAYVAANPDRIAVSTVSEMAEAANVQPSAFMRFCQELGFTGYSQMQRVFRNDYAVNGRTTRPASKNCANAAPTVPPRCWPSSSTPGATHWRR
jgi:DNA-binding MurR/RpiR family transcriptional regulator